jgi:hypothetical protein
MGLDYMTDHPWAAVAAWAVLYVLDYYLTIAGAALVEKGAGRHVIFEKGYELTPCFQKDVSLLRRISPRFLGMLLMSSLILGGLWFLFMRLEEARPVFEFILGLFILVELVILVRHMNNLCLFRYLRASEGVEGSIRYARWLSLRLSSGQFLTFCACFIMLWLLTGRWFFAGGALGCLFIGLQHLSRSSRESVRASGAGG